MYKEAPSKILNWTYKDTIRTSQPVNNVYIRVSPKNTFCHFGDQNVLSGDCFGLADSPEGVPPSPPKKK